MQMRKESKNEGHLSGLQALQEMYRERQELHMYKLQKSGSCRKNAESIENQGENVYRGGKK